MDSQNSGLTPSERAELEALRAEKARREAAEQEARDRAELEALRAQKQAELERAQEDARLEEARRRMEPGDDLRMPVAQKVVLVLAALLFIAAIWWVAFAPK